MLPIELEFHRRFRNNSLSLSLSRSYTLSRAQRNYFLLRNKLETRAKTLLYVRLSITRAVAMTFVYGLRLRSPGHFLRSLVIPDTLSVCGQYLQNGAREPESRCARFMHYTPYLPRDAGGQMRKWTQLLHPTVKRVGEEGGAEGTPPNRGALGSAILHSPLVR